ncbi:MAG: hypothetical protein FJ206_09875 [Gemmatimonadetes bacterium]|nr:hypothetical protein [Gemmatimonadota bacterium]
MGRRDRDVVYLEREGGGGLKWLVLGAALGAGLALLFAPRSGRELRRELGRGIKGMRELADETWDEIRDEFGAEDHSRRSADEGASAGDDGGDDRPSRQAERPRKLAAREELERRLEAARARRRPPVTEADEEPVA